MINEGENEISSTLLSVVIISVNTRESLRNCLDSILLSQKLENVEVIVADGCGDESFSELIDLSPIVNILQFPGKTTIPILAAAGIKHCKGDIIALTDSSCVVDINWIPSILKAHQSASLVIGGAVEKSGPLSLLDLAVYFCEYGQFMYPLSQETVQELPGNNISFKSASLSKIGHEFWKSHWCAKLQNEGVKLKADPSVLVYYHKNYKLLSLLGRRFQHGRCFAAMRSAQSSVFKRTFLAGASIILPFIFLSRTVKVIFQKKRLITEFFLAFPFVVLTIVAWSFGETCGYLLSKGKSNEKIY